MAAISYVAGNVMYNSTKAFLKAFTENLALDLQGKKIKVQALCPGFTYTEFHDVGDYQTKGFQRSIIPEYLWMTAADCVSQSLANLGRGIVAFVPGEQNRELLAKLGIKID